MIHPSYNELYEAINKDSEKEEPVVNSRYSVCVATAKRARQLIDGAEPLVKSKCNKPLSTAIDEIYQGKVSILAGEEENNYSEFETEIDTEIEEQN